MQGPKSVQDIMKDPSKYGAPSFEEFCKNPSKYSAVASVEEELGSIDNGGSNLRKILKKITYHVGFQEFKSLERAVQFCHDHNIDVTKWKVKVEKIPGHWAHEKVIFMSEEDFEKRSKW
jgi:hypothetical protein